MVEVIGDLGAVDPLEIGRLKILLEELQEMSRRQQSYINALGDKYLKNSTKNRYIVSDIYTKKEEGCLQKYSQNVSHRAKNYEDYMNSILQKYGYKKPGGIKKKFLKDIVRRCDLSSDLWSM